MASKVHRPSDPEVLHWGGSKWWLDVTVLPYTLYMYTATDFPGAWLHLWKWQCWLWRCALIVVTFFLNGLILKLVGGTSATLKNTGICLVERISFVWKTAPRVPDRLRLKLLDLTTCRHRSDRTLIIACDVSWVHNAEEIQENLAQTTFLEEYSLSDNNNSTCTVKSYYIIITVYNFFHVYTKNMIIHVCI